MSTKQRVRELLDRLPDDCVLSAVRIRGFLAVEVSAVWVGSECRGGEGGLPPAHRGGRAAGSAGEAECGEGGTEGKGAWRRRLGGRGRSEKRQDLPDAVGIAGAPGSVCDQAEVDQAIERLIEVAAWDRQGVSHARSAEEGRALAVGREGQQEQDGCGLRPETSQPAFMEQAGLEPAEGARRSADEIGTGRCGTCSSAHDAALPGRRVRLSRRLSARSLASLSR
jgi:hypothetical protein